MNKDKINRRLETLSECHALNPSVLNCVRLLLEELPDIAPFPHLSASDDGEIGLTWLRASDRLEVLINADTVEWLTEVRGVYTNGHPMQTALFDTVTRTINNALVEFFAFAGDTK